MHAGIRVRVPRPIYAEFVSVIEASRSVLFVRYRGREIDLSSSSL